MVYLFCYSIKDLEYIDVLDVYIYIFFGIEKVEKMLIFLLNVI